MEILNHVFTLAEIGAMSVAGLFFAFILYKILSRGKGKGTTGGKRDRGGKQSMK